MPVTAGNGSGRRGQAAVRRLRGAWPDAIMICTPARASWLSQAEIFFSAVQEKALTPGGFASLDEPAGALLAFTGRCNQAARPFSWKFTAVGLARLPGRASAREHAAEEPAGLPEAA